MIRRKSRQYKAKVNKKL